eukprot:96281_1
MPLLSRSFANLGPHITFAHAKSRTSSKQSLLATAGIGVFLAIIWRRQKERIAEKKVRSDSRQNVDSLTTVLDVSLPPFVQSQIGDDVRHLICDYWGDLEKYPPPAQPHQSFCGVLTGGALGLAIGTATGILVEMFFRKMCVKTGVNPPLPRAWGAVVGACWGYVRGMYAFMRKRTFASGVLSSVKTVSFDALTVILYCDAINTLIDAVQNPTEAMISVLLCYYLIDDVNLIVQINQHDPEG